MRTPFIYNLRRDPYERVDDHLQLVLRVDARPRLHAVPAQAYVAKFLETFKEFPPRQKAASFSLDRVMEKLSPPTN